jgi:hypothetical protein
VWVSHCLTVHWILEEERSGHSNITYLTSSEVVHTDVSRDVADMVFVGDMDDDVEDCDMVEARSGGEACVVSPHP